MEQLRASPVEIRKKLTDGEQLTQDEFEAATALAMFVPNDLRPAPVEAEAVTPPVEQPTPTAALAPPDTTHVRSQGPPPDEEAEQRALADERLEALGKAAPPEPAGGFAIDAPGSPMAPPDPPPIDHNLSIETRLQLLEAWALQFWNDVTRATNAKLTSHHDLVTAALAPPPPPPPGE